MDASNGHYGNFSVNRGPRKQGAKGAENTPTRRYGLGENRRFERSIQGSIGPIPKQSGIVQRRSKRSMECETRLFPKLNRTACQLTTLVYEAKYFKFSKFSIKQGRLVRNAG